MLEVMSMSFYTGLNPFNFNLSWTVPWPKSTATFQTHGISRRFYFAAAVYFCTYSVSTYTFPWWKILHYKVTEVVNTVLEILESHSLYAIYNTLGKFRTRSISIRSTTSCPISVWSVLVLYFHLPLDFCLFRE